MTRMTRKIQKVKAMYKVTKPAGIFWVKDMMKYQDEQKRPKHKTDSDFQDRLDREIDKLRGKE